MKLTIESIIPSNFYDGRVINYKVNTKTISGQQYCCYDPSGAASYLRPGDRIDGLLTALRYTLVTDKLGDNCITGIVRNSMPSTFNNTYECLLNNHFIGLETIDGTLFLYYSEKDKMFQPLNDGQIVTVLITGGLYLELILSDQYAV